MPKLSTPAARRNIGARSVGYAAAAAIVGACTLLSGVSHLWELTEANVVMIFLAGVALTAALFGHGPAIVAIGLSVLAFDYFFVHPSFSLATTDAQYFITLAGMLGIGVLIIELTGRLQVQLAASRMQESRTARLYEMTREFGRVASFDALLEIAGAQVAETFSGEVVIGVRSPDGQVELRFGSRNNLGREPTTLTIANWVGEHARGAGRGTPNWSDADALFAPMIGSKQLVGVIGVRCSDRTHFDDPEERRMLETCANLIGLSLERAQSQHEAQQAQMQVQHEQLRNTLLTSISHDLRTPLATIAVTTSSLLDDPVDENWDDKREILETLVDETRQMSRQVDNLLDLGRLASNDAPLALDWHVLEELIGVALSRLGQELLGHDVQVDIPDDFPMIYVADDLIVQVFVNLLANAARYTPPGSRIAVAAERTNDRVIVQFADNGPGIPAGLEEQVFGKFVRGTTTIADGRRGLGLGLAICRSIVQAHHGEITARNLPTGGAVLTVSLPSPRESPQVTLDDVFQTRGG